MNQSNEKIIIHQLHTLLEQLEDLQNEHSEVAQERSRLPQQITDLFINMSCDRYWIFDPATNMVEVTITHPRKDHKSVICRSFSEFLMHVNVEERKSVSYAFERLIQCLSMEETYEYSTSKDAVTKVYEVVAHSYMEDGKQKIVGVTKILGEVQLSFSQLVQAQQKFELLMGLSSMYIWEYDVVERTFIGNKSLCEKLGLPQRAFSSDEIQELLGVPSYEHFVQQVKEQRLSDGEVIHIQTVTSKFELIFETNYKAVTNKHGDYTMILGTMNDITEKELLKTMASQDSLTDCYNRSMADITLESTFKKFASQGDFYTIIFFDIDKFKLVNDRYGHDMGDFVLTKICQLMQQEIRSTDMMFRWGGDEFLLICSGIAKENIYAYIDRLRKRIEFSTFVYKDIKLQITISIGAAYYYRNDADFQAAMKRADRSLYKAKLAGRNKVCILK